MIASGPVHRRARGMLACLSVVLAAACGGPGSPPPSEEGAWRDRLLAAPGGRDAALVELRKRGTPGVPLVLALLADDAITKAPTADLLREELVFMLGESGAGDPNAQRLLVRLLDDAATPVQVALAAARGLVVSWRLYRDATILDAYVRLLDRATTPDDVRRATAVNGLVLKDFRIPYEPSFLAVLRKGARSLRSAGFAVRCLRRFEGRQRELASDYTTVATWLDGQAKSDDAAVEAEKLAVRELVSKALAEASAR